MARDEFSPVGRPGGPADAAGAGAAHWYFYGVTVAEPLANSREGVGGAAVELIVEAPLAAVVSRLGTGKVRAQRANLAAHHHVLGELAGQRPVLPAVFGTVTGSQAGAAAPAGRIVRSSPACWTACEARWRWD